MIIENVKTPGTGADKAHYPVNRQPLLPSPMAKLPLGSVRPQGWLMHQLELMKDGMVGRLHELSKFLNPDNGWFGTDQQGWEEQPYWFRGFYSLAVLTEDERLLAEAKRWIEAVLTSQDEDGYFGPRANKHVKGNKGDDIVDFWPNMIMIDALILHYEYTSDNRVIPFLREYFQFCANVPEERFIKKISVAQYEQYEEEFGHWKCRVQTKRSGDMLPHIYWLYNEIQEEWLLDLAVRFYEKILPPYGEWLDDHVVNFTQRFRYPGNYYVQSKQGWHLKASEYWYGQHLSTWGQQPRGTFAADERIRPGQLDPRQGFETCGMVEFAKSFYILGRITGEGKYADRCEDIMLNHFPAAQTPDLKALHYVTAANMPQIDGSNEHDIYNNVEMKSKSAFFKFSPHKHRCCQHNVAMGWPWFAENLWQATADGGVAAWMYGASIVSAAVGEHGQKVTIQEETNYPFNENVSLKIMQADRVTFPLYVRVPGWCKDFGLMLNGQKITVPTEPQSYVRIEREWSTGDVVELDMGMEPTLTQWPRNGSVTVDRGPLSYSVKIAENWKASGGTDEWPEWEVYPESPWNYGLIVNQADAGLSLQVHVKEAVSNQPWTVDHAPVEIKARAKRIKDWKFNHVDVQELRSSPIRSDEAEEWITLIPMACGRLRMTCLPVIGEGRDAKYWNEA